MKLHILVLEDVRPYGAFFTKLAHDQGHEITLVHGAFAKAERWIVGIDTNGARLGIGTSEERVNVHPSTFNLGLLDYSQPQAEGCLKYTGGDFADVLVPAGVVCYGMGSWDKQSADLKKRGCVLAPNKGILLIALWKGIVSLEELYTDPTGATAKLAEFTARMTEEEEKSLTVSKLFNELNDAADELLK